VLIRSLPLLNFFIALVMLIEGISPKLKKRLRVPSVSSEVLLGWRVGMMQRAAPDHPIGGLYDQRGGSPFAPASSL
jgi:hypothetical protein